ncbi:hypothetical protein COL55_30340, partial [Bacillus toyonensis]
MSRCRPIKPTNHLSAVELRKIEKTEKNASNQFRITAVRMVMEDYSMVDVAAILGMHRQSVSRVLLQS